MLNRAPYAYLQANNYVIIYSGDVPFGHYILWTARHAITEAAKACVMGIPEHRILDTVHCTKKRLTSFWPHNGFILRIQTASFCNFHNFIYLGCTFFSARGGSIVSIKLNKFWLFCGNTASALPGKCQKQTLHELFRITDLFFSGPYVTSWREKCCKGRICLPIAVVGHRLTDHKCDIDIRAEQISVQELISNEMVRIFGKISENRIQK